MIPIANPSFEGRERSYVLDAIESGWLSHRGPYVERFEEALSERFGKPAITTSSGTGALHLALQAAGIGPGDEVIVPAVTFASTAAAVKAVGAHPVLVDVDDRMQISTAEVWRNISDSTRAIIAVHLYGLSPDLDVLQDMALTKALWLIEDAAEIIEPYEVKSDFACLSFFANKWITTGEGGALFTDFEATARLWRDHGMTHPYFHEVPGLNYRMTNLQAAIGLAQLEKHEANLKRRKAILARYREAIPEGRGTWLYIVPKRPMTCIEARPVFQPLHTLPPYRSNRHFPNAEKLWRDFMCLPTAAHLSDEDVDNIIGEYRGR